jgi:hypothetical protein
MDEMVAGLVLYGTECWATKKRDEDSSHAVSLTACDENANVEMDVWSN